jgi:hypothetical protein
MHRKIAVAEIEVFVATATIIKINKLYEPTRFPVGLKFNGNNPDVKSLNDWWQGRSIPASRQNIQEAMQNMGITSSSELLTKCFGLSLSDQYWVNPVETPLDWDKINFFHNDFSEDVGNALFGDAQIGGNINLASPDNTSDGWLKKKWKIIDGKRCLIKGGSMPFWQEPINEAIATALMQRLGISHIPYTVVIDDEMPHSVCECFVTPETELVSAWYISQSKKQLNHESPYQHFMKSCIESGIPGVQKSLDEMLVTDFLIFNEDRHYNNFGAVRNAQTLEWLGLAPIFDSGTSLWYNQVTFNHSALKRIKVKPFRTLHEEQIKYVSDFSWIDFSALNGIEKDFHSLLSLSPLIEESRIEKLCEMFNNRVQLLQNHIRSIEPQSVAIPPKPERLQEKFEKKKPIVDEQKANPPESVKKPNTKEKI